MGYPDIPAFDLADWVIGHTDRIAHNLTNSSIKSPSLSEMGIEVDYQEFQQKRAHLKGAFKRVLAETYDVPESNVLVTCSGSEALYLAVGSTIKPNADVIVPTPNYPPTFQIPRLFNANIKILPTRMEKTFHPDLQELGQLISPRTGLLILSNPNNPTGCSMDKQSMEGVLELAKGFPVVVDEAFRNFGFENAPPLAATLSDNAISLGTMSKFYGLEDLRIGWIIANKATVERAARLKNWVTIENSRFSEMIACKAIENLDRFTKRARKFRDQNLKAVEDWIKKRPDMEWVKPNSGLICFPKYKFKMTSKELGVGLVDKHGVAVSPGTFFGQEGHFRLCFTRTLQEVRAALIALENGLKSIAER